MKRLLVLAAALGAACVPYPGQAPPDYARPAVVSGPFALLDPGASQLDSLHFTVRAYGSDPARQVSETAEAAYNRIMVDTNLYSFRPAGLYQIVVYASQDEYRRKTGQPEWSGGLSVGNSIFSFMGPRLHQTVAHEMTHLVFYEFMGRVSLDHRWVNEGLAVYEEEKASGAEGRGGIFAAVRGNLRQQPMTMDQMIHLVPATEREHTVSAWYAQAESLVRFMMERGGRIGFSQFLEALKAEKGFDAAIAAGFPGVWRSLSELEQSWLRSLQ